MDGPRRMLMHQLARYLKPVKMSPLERFSKKKWLQWYNDADQNLELFLNIFPAKKDILNAGISAIRCAYEYEDPKYSSAPLSSLRVMTLPELIVGARHFGRVLHGQLCVKATRVQDILTLMEDSSCRVMRVLLCNAVSSTLSPEEVEARFPEGAKITIKEPFFELGQESNGFGAIKVDNPEDLLINDEDTGSWLDSIDLEVRRKEGNRLFAGGEWMGAVAKYSICINEALRRKKSLKVDREHYLDRNLVAAYSNRAEARLRMQENEKALADASKALELDPKHVKSLVRKSRAAHDLGLQEEACTILSTALKQFPGDESLLNCLKFITCAPRYEKSGHRKFIFQICCAAVALFCAVVALLWNAPRFK